MEDSLFWLITASYAAHIMEEYILNWKKWVCVYTTHAKTSREVEYEPSTFSTAALYRRPDTT